MSAQKPDGVVPKLRFPEFDEFGEWKFEPLQSLAIRCSTKNNKGAHIRVLTNSAERGVLDQRDYFEKDIATQGNLEGYFIVEKGDYVYNPRISATAPVGPISKNKIGTGVMSPLYTVFRFKDTNNDFFEHYFRSTHWHAYMRLNSSTGARHDRMSITNDAFMALPLPTPSLPEQQKIANCLTSLDEVITAEAQKLDALKAHKKGLMQQLFPAERKTVPKLRFPEFRDSGEWALISFENLNLDVGDGNYSAKYPKQSDFINAGVPFLRANNIRNGTVSDDDMRFISREQHAELQKGHLKAGDILLSTRGELGNVALVPERHIDSNINAQLVRINAGNSLSHKFLFQVLDYCRIVGKFEALSTGTALKQLPIGKLNMLELNLPKTVPEQQKIADCIAALDELIAAQAEKMDALKAQKKGLLRGLFADHPAPTGHPSAGGEGSGKVSVSGETASHKFPSRGGVAGAARRGGLESPGGVAEGRGGLGTA